MRIGVVTAVEPVGSGLHRDLAAGLGDALRAAGHETELVMVPFSPTRDVLQQAWAFRTLPLATAFDRVVTLRPPAHLVVHPRKVAWLSQHIEYGAQPETAEDRMLADADRTALLAAEGVFATSEAAAEHWSRRAGVDARVMRSPAPPAHEPPLMPAVPLVVHSGEAGAGMMVEAMRFVQTPVRLHLDGKCGSARLQDELALRTAGLATGRVRWGIDQENQGMEQASAIACLSADDDAVLPLLDRAAVLGRPVLVSWACRAAADRVVAHGAGLAVDATDPHAIAAALDALHEPARAEALRAGAAASLAGRPSWDDVAWALLAP